MAKTQQLDLYATPGFRESFNLKTFGWKGWIGLAVTVLLLGGAATYGWMTNSAPVTADQALAEFRKNAAQSSGSSNQASTSPRSKSASKKQDNKQGPARKGAEAGGGDKTPSKVAVAAAGSNQTTQQNQPDKLAAPARGSGGDYGRAAPREGVYSWDTEGWESAGGARRNFPEETQRIITLEDNGWMNHHYFSDNREIWTNFVVVDEGAAIARQRNKVTFGPVTNDSTIDMDPPILVGPRDLKVGQTWSGRWSGKTSGVYQGETFEKVQLNIGGETVEAWGIHVHTEMRGEVEGEVDATVWLAPKYALTVKEHYKQRVKVDVGDYRAEWTMTLKSLEPRR